jgi:hypothetical protein
MVGAAGTFIGLVMIAVAVFREAHTSWITAGRLVTFFSLLTILLGLIRCVLASNNIFGS